MAAKPTPTSKPIDESPDAPAEPAPAKPAPKPAAKPKPTFDPNEPIGSAKRGDQEVYPVEFHGFMGKDALDQPVRVTETFEGGMKWAVYNPRDIGPAGRQRPKREPAKHPSRHRRLFYNQEEAAVYDGLPGFKVLPAEIHTPLKPTGPNVAEHVTKVRGQGHRTKPFPKG